MLRLTTDHPQSSYGVPVFVQGRRVLEYSDGVAQLQEQLELSTAELARRCNVSPRTVEGWRAGRMPAVAALNAMAALLNGRKTR